MQLVHAKKFLGQHFLTDLSVAQRIAETLTSGRTIEIGPGMGVLTQYLLKNPAIQLTAIEIDRESVAYLREWYPELDLVEGDFLKLDLNQLIPEGSEIIRTTSAVRSSLRYWTTKIVFLFVRV